MLLLATLSGCIPFMVVGAGNSAHSKVKVIQLEKRLIKLEKELIKHDHHRH